MQGDAVAVKPKKSPPPPGNYLNVLNKINQSLIKISRYSSRDLNPEPLGYKESIT